MDKDERIKELEDENAKLKVYSKNKIQKIELNK